MTRTFWITLTALVFFFGAVAYAQVGPPVPDLTNLNLQSIAALLIWAVQHKAYRYLVAGALIATIYGVRALEGMPLFANVALLKWFKTDRGGALLALLLSECAGLSTALLAPTFSWMHLVDAASMALTAVGGYTVLRRILKPSDKTTPPGGGGVVSLKQSPVRVVEPPPAIGSIDLSPKGSFMRSFFFAFALLSFAVLSCATVGPAVCGKGNVLVPPNAKACSEAFVAAIETVPSAIAACAVEAGSAACIDTVLAGVADLVPCEPTCGPGPVVTDGGASGGGSSVKVSKAVLRTNVMESMKSTGMKYTPKASK